MNARTSAVLAVIGNPASGKTSLMRAFLRGYRPWYDMKIAKGVMGMRCDHARLTVLGRYDDGDMFAGTDRLSMSAQPAVLRWIEQSSDDVVFEGDRLANGAFFHAVKAMPSRRLHIVMLDVAPGFRAARQRERGTQQNETWLAGRETKYKNLLADETLAPYVTTHRNECFDDQQAAVRLMRARLTPQSGGAT